MYIYICSKAFHMHVSLPLSIYMYTGLGHWPVMAQRDDCLHGTAPYTHVYIYIYIFIYIYIYIHILYMIHKYNYLFYFCLSTRPCIYDYARLP